VERCAGVEVVQTVLQFGELGRIGNVDLGQQSAIKGSSDATLLITDQQFSVAE
jgi:hypothetical protein